MSTEQRTQHGPALDGGREGPGDAMSLPGAGGAPVNGAGGAVGAGSDQSAEPVWRYQVPPPGSGTGAGESNAGHYTPNAAGHGGGIVSAPAESNVNDPGRPLSGAGSATDPAGGTIGGIQASKQAQETGGAAAAGNPGESLNADGNLSGSAGTDNS
jgi:hypothetical protein